MLSTGADGNGYQLAPMPVHVATHWPLEVGKGVCLILSTLPSVVHFKNEHTHDRMPVTLAACSTGEQNYILYSIILIASSRWKPTKIGSKQTNNL